MMKRFWSKVSVGKPDACWPWKGNRHRQGYGFFKVGTRNVLAHRVAYCLTNGLDILKFSSKIKVLHSCDNQPCCNPAHLFVGTQKNNIDDMIAKGRRGTCSAKLTPEQVIAIRADDRPYADIAAEYGVARHTVYLVVTRRRWRNLGRPA